MSESTKKYLLVGSGVLCILIIAYFLYSSSLKKIVIVDWVPTIVDVVKVPKFNYIEIVDGCGPNFSDGTCVNLREGPGTKYPVAFRLRNGVVLAVADTIEVDGKKWYKILFANELLYPERIKEDVYVAAEYAKLFTDEGNRESLKTGDATTTKRIVVDVSKQKLYAYDGEELFMEEPISTGLEFTPTPRGTFSVFKMTPSRFMQGPIPGVSDQVYDLPGVPWNLYFTAQGAVIHGAYWHDNFGKKWSHGCVNLSPENARKLYEWAEIGMPVMVQN